jgi:hypothetical protein
MKRLWAIAGLGVVLAATAAAETPQQKEAAPDKERWLYVAVQGGAFGWEDAQLMRNAAAGTVQAMRFMYYSKPVTNQAKPFSWVVQDVEINCKARTLMLMDGEFMNEDGDLVGELTPWDKPQAIRPGPDELLAQVLCDGVKVKDTHESDDMLQAMDGAAKIALP